MDEEEQERKRKLEAGKAKLAQFRQRKGQSDGQNTAKKNKKKKTSSNSKQRDNSELVSEAALSQSEDASSQTAPSGAGTTAEFTIMRTLPQGEMIQHDKTYTIEPESEVSTTADDYSSEVVDDRFSLPANNHAHILWEEEFGVRETFPDRGTQSSQARLEVMEDELAGKQQEIDELNRELEEMRAAYGNEGLQQLQEFETAIKQRDGIITQLTSNLQQARKEKDDIMREFLELTEQSQKLKIQFQHLQAGETLRNTSHTSTAADLLHSKQQILTYQLQLEERDHHLTRCQKENEDLRTQITSLRDQIHSVHQGQQRQLESSYEKKLHEKDSAVESLKSALHNEEIKCTELKERIYAAEKSVDELREELTQKSQEINSLSEELNSSKQRERRSSDEIKQLMGAVEDLQKKHHKDSQSEADLAQRMESETQRKLEQLQAELDEMYGQQIVQMKQELVRQHTLEIERLLVQHKQELESISRQTTINVTSERINELNAVISELNAKLEESDEQRKKMKEDLSKKLEVASSEKSHLQQQIEDLLQDLSFAREQIHKAKQSLTEKENQLNEANSFLTTIDDLKAELVAAKEFTKELESKHEAEVTNYKIKLEMLEREKDAVLDRMAESQEAELEKLRTYFLFSQEEELSKLREELGREHRTNIENLKDNLEMKYKKQIEQIQCELNQTITAMQSEKDSLITKQNNLTLEISKLKDSPQCVYDSKTEELMVQINELQKELECLRREEQEKGSIEHEVQTLQLRIQVLEKEVEDKDALNEKLVVLEADNRLLKDENDALQNMTKDRNTENCQTLTELAHLELKKQIEGLSSENERLRNLELQLKEEIEQQNNTFSFAEKNFEVNYHELKDEYTFLVKENAQLLDSKSKMEEVFRLRLEALHDELAKLKGDGIVDTQVASSKSIKVDRLDVGEIVEKDTTELMEKLELAQRDKQELSIKLSSLSEELQSKQNEINQLKEKVKSMGLERDHDTIEEESCMTHKDYVSKVVSSQVLVSSDGDDTRREEEESIRPIEVPHLHVSPEVGHLQKELQEALLERESLLQRLQELTDKLETEKSVVESARVEKDELQRLVDSAVQEQTDLMLQLEAQRISLTQIHKAHVELISENFRAERERELCRLRDSLLASQEQKIQDLQELHQQELLSRPAPQQQTAAEGETCQDLTEMLMKRIREEFDHINQVHGEKLISEEDTIEEVLYSLDDTSSQERHRTALQTLHSNLESLLETFVKEYKQMKELSSCMEKTGDLQGTKEETEIPVVTQIVIHSQCSAPQLSGDQEAAISPASQSQEVERLKIEFSQQRSQLDVKHAQEIEHLRSYFQQQLKENEDRYSAEIIHLQEKLQDVPAGSLESRELGHIETAVELGPEEAAIFQSIVTPSSDVLKIDDAAKMDAHQLRQPFGPIYQQLQSLRQALYTKYVEEVNALKKQHEAELDQLRAELTEENNKENSALKQEIIHLTKAKQEILNGSFQEAALYPIPEERDPEDLNQLVEERFREKIEEEVARVIVEMTIAFAQQSELARLAELKDEDITEPRGTAEEHGEVPAVDRQKVPGVTSSEESPVTDSVNLADIPSSDTTQQTKDLTPEQQDGSLLEKTVVLKEEDYNQLVAMGAESVKYKHMYEEKVEDMRQELVRQEQEYQQATEALRMAHAAQLERQMNDQEQLLLEVHRLRAQLAENASTVTEKQAADREKMLLEELESMKQTCAQARSRLCPVQDGSSQTQDERLPRPESKEQDWECEQGDEEKKEDEEGIPSDARKNLKRTNKNLLKILLEVVKTTGAAEETIGRHVVGLLDKPGRRQSTSKVHVWSAESEQVEASPSAAAITVTAGPGDADVGAGVEGASIWSAPTVEELDVPLQLTEEEFSGTDLSPDDEAQILNISTRLQAAVEKLLVAITDTSNQLAHAKAAQTELVRESLKRKQETAELLRCQEDLQERLNEEAKAREHLALELSKAEGLLDGYTDERVFLEKQMQDKNDLIRHLEQELQSTGNRLQELEQERQQIQEEKELLSRQKLALKADAAPAEQQLLEETEKLLKEKIEVQRQAEKDSGDLNKQVKVLEVELEDQVNRFMELEQEKNADLEDLRQKNLSLEKQLEKTRRFLDEQAVDREHERDVFQQEIQKLEQQLKVPQRHQPVTEDQSNEVEKLESNLKEKTDKCSELLLCKEQLQRDVQERNEEMEKLEARIRELEQALIISSDSLHKVEDRRPSIVIGLKGEMPLEAQLQVEREAIDRKEKEITNLVEQLEQFREELENKNEEVQQLHMQLEIQSKESDTRLQELEQENKVLKGDAESTQQVHPETFTPKGPHPKLGKMEELLLLKDQEIDHLSEQIGKLQAQLESATDNKVIEEKNEQIMEYKSQVKCLKSDQERLKKNSEEEIEKLNEVIEKLQEELSRIEQKVAVDFSEKHQYEDMADKNEFLEPLISHGDVPVTNIEEENVDASKPLVNSMAVKHENRRNEISTVPSKLLSEPEDMQFSLQNMEAKLKELMDVIKEKDEQIVMLEKQNLAIKNQEGTVNSMAVEHENTCNTDRRNEISTVPSKPLPEPEDIQVTLQNMESTLKELMDIIKEKDEQIVMLENQILILKDQEDRVNNMAAEHENTSNTDRRNDISTVPSKPLSESEDMQITMHNMESKLKELMDVIKKKDEQIVMLEKKTLEMKDQKETVNNIVVELENTSNTDRKNDISTVPSKPLSEPEDMQVTLHSMESKLKELMDVIKEKDEQIVILEKKNLEMKDLKETEKNMAEEHENTSNTDMRNKISTIPSKPLSEPENMQVTLHNMESKLKELTDIVKKKDEQIVILEEKTLVMKELEKTVKRLQTELEDQDQKFREMQSSGDQLSPKRPVRSTNTEESNADEMLMDKEMVSANVEIQPLKEVLEKSMESSENLVKKKRDDTVHIERLTEELREKTAKYLAVEALLVSVQEASKDAIHRLEIQLQDLQTAVHEKDSQILQLTNASPLLENQEIERLNDVVRDLQEKLSDAEEKIKEAREGQPETLVESTEILLQKVGQDESELARMKAELQKATLEISLLEKELEKHKLLQGSINIKKDEESKTNETSIGGALVTSLEQTFTQKIAEPLGVITSVDETTINTVKNMELQIQELQNVIHLKDVELLQYTNQKDFLEQQMKEIERLNKSLEDSTKGKRKRSVDSNISTKDDESQTSSIENMEVQKNSALQAELEETKSAMALLKEKLEKVKDIKTKDEVSQTYHQETLTENEEHVLQKIGEDDGKVLPIKAKLDKTRMEMDMLEEKMAKVKLFQGSVDLQESDEIENAFSDTDGRQVTSLKPVTSGKAALSEGSQILSTSMNTTEDMELHIQQLQNIIHLKDAELLQCENQKDLIKQQVQEIEQLKKIIREEGKVLMGSSVSTKDGQSDETSIRENRDGKKSDDGDSVLQAELQQAKMEVAALKEELIILKESKKHTDQKIEASSTGKVNKAKIDKRDIEEAEREKEEEPSQAIYMSSEETIQNAELLQFENQKDLLKQQAQEIEQLKAVIQARKVSGDSNAPTKDEESQTSHGTTTAESREVPKDYDGDSILQAELQQAKMDLAALKEELEKLKEFKKHTDLRTEEASNEGEGHKAKLDKRDTEEALKETQVEPSQTVLTSTQETTQHVVHKMEPQLQVMNIEEASNKEEAHETNLDKRVTEEAQAEPSQSTLTSSENIHDLEIRLQELQKVVQQKDSELQQYLKQQTVVSQQTMEIEQLHDMIVTLNQKLAEAEVKMASLSNTEGVEQVRDEEKEMRPHVNGESTITNSYVASVEVTQDSEQLLRSKDNIDGQDLLQGKSSGDDTYDDGVVGALREKTAHHVANQVLLTSVQETMQNTIDTMESQLQEMQNAIQEKDLEILLYLEEIETLKEQVKAESDQHGQMMEALEDSLREKVAAALVSDAQLKAIQAHTKELRDDDRPAMPEEEARTLLDLSAKPSTEEEAESKLSALSLRLLELEKQLSDLHEQLQVEREQVNVANRKAAEKEIKLYEMQKVLESSWGNVDINWAKCEPETVNPVLSQGLIILPEDNTATDLENVLQSVQEEASATKEELCHYREMTEKLKEELMVKESSLTHLDEDLREVRKCLAHAEEKLAFYMKKELQEEEQQIMSGVDFTDGVRSPEWGTRERSTSSSSQTDMVPSVNSSNQTSLVHHKNIGVQKELETARLSNTSEEVAELMERYTDKISQMQELHAAEILDMEARHISEADTLRREQYAVVQALTNECEALKAVIEALKSSGGIVPDSALSTSYHLTDAASSECDWSQGTYDAQSLDQLPEGLRVEDEVPAELIPSKIKDLLRAVHQEGMQVLSLTEATSPEKDKPFTLNTQTWREERKTLIEAIASLKDLIAKMQIYKEPEVHARTDFHERTPDWRGELLRAIQEVFCKEQDALLSAFHTQLASLGDCDATALVNQMQHRLQEQGIEQINAMDCIQNAERRSLLLEIQDLRAQLTSLQIDRNIDSLHHTEGAAHYTPQDQSSFPQEMHLQLSGMKASASELQEQLGSERLLSAEIKNELALTKMELESTLKLQHKHFKELESLRMELKRRRDELESVNDVLANEQKKTRELQWALEKEKTKTERSDQHEKEELEDLQILLEEQKTKTVEMNKRLEEEQLLVKSLQEQLASKESLHDAALSQERSKVSELQAVLDAEKTRSGELANVLERRQSIEAHVDNTDGSGQPEVHNPTEELLRDLQGQLDSKHHRIVELVTETEGYKLECVQLRQNLDEETQRLRKELEKEKEATMVAKKQAEELQFVVEELQQQIQSKVREIRRLQAEEKRLKETIQSLQSSQRTKESGSESSASSRISADPVRSEVHQPMESVPNVLCPDPFSTVDGDPGAEETEFSVDTIRQRLQHVSSKLRQLASKATRRVMFDATDDDNLAWSQRAVQEVTSQLENVSMLSLQGQNLVLPSGMSANTLTEKLLTQNAELTGYVSRLTNEKNDLQNALLRLEGEISHHRAREGSGDQSPQSTWDHTMSADSFTEEREAWNREKLNLHKSLKQTEAELSKVKAELRNESIQRDLGRDTENAALKRIYGKYLRSESFRKALVYQKKYLLLLLGGFQECEEATLALIARMGGQPSYTDLEVITKHSRAFTRFRSAARVVIAISRMKFLVRRWQRAISPVGGSANRNGLGQGNEMRTDSPYHPAGSVDMYGDQRLSFRSRSGFDSPQSTVNSQHRYASSDLSTCSHLQNYDPDRALTDYIARLEALQKRLGSAPSGPAPNSTTHYSIRR